MSLVSLDILCRRVLVDIASLQLHGSDRGAATASASLSESLLVQVGALGAAGKVGLHLPVLGKVEGSDLLGLLDLLLVGLGLALELINQSLHPLVVLPVLVLLVGQLLDVPLRLAQVLLCVGAPPVLGIHLRLELTNASLHLGHGLLAALQGVLFSFITSVLSVLHLRLKKFLIPLQSHSKLLLLPELISQPGSINHSTLGLVLGHASLADHLVQVVAHGAHLLLALHLGSADRLVGAGLVAERLVGISQLLLYHAAVAVSLLKQGSSFLESILVCVGTPVSRDQAVRGRRLRAAFLLETLLHIADVALSQTRSGCPWPPPSRGFPPRNAFAHCGCCLESDEIRLSVAAAFARLSSSKRFCTLRMLP